MKKIKQVILPAATALVFGTSGCGSKDEQSAKEQANDKLIGQWEITDADGDLSYLLISSYYKFNLEFHLAGDAEFCLLENSESYKSCNIGEWDWTNSDYTMLEMEVGTIGISLDIDSFDGDLITGEMTLTASYDTSSYEYTGSVTLERVYVDKSALKDAPAEMDILKSLKAKQNKEN
jgi:hypothetical protein